MSIRLVQTLFTLVTLFVVGCESKLSKFPFVAASGSRLKVRAYDQGVPVQLQPVTFFDSKMGIECSASKAADSKLRCLPATYDSGTTYSDAACSVRAYAPFGCNEDLEPKFMVVAEPSEAGDYCATNTFAENISKLKPAKVYALGAKAKGVLFNKASDGTCAASGSTSVDYFSVSGDADPSQFAEFTVRYQPDKPGGFASVIIESTDGAGARIAVVAHKDGSPGPMCTIVGTTCFAGGAAVARFHETSSCQGVPKTAEVFGCKPAYFFVQKFENDLDGWCAENGDTIVYQDGVLQDQAFQKSGDTCSATGTPGTFYRINESSSVDYATLPSTNSGILRSKKPDEPAAEFYGNSEDNLVQFKGFIISSKIQGLAQDLPCTPRGTASGLRCIPNDAKSGLLDANGTPTVPYFSDSACTKPQLFELREPCRKPPQVLVFEKAPESACGKPSVVSVRTLFDAGPSNNNPYRKDPTTGACTVAPVQQGNRFEIGESNILDQLPRFESDKTFLP